MVRPLIPGEERGQWNEDKDMCFQLLSEVGHKPITAEGMVYYLPIDKHVLHTLLGSWTKRHYVRRHGFAGSYSYTLAARGRRWLDFMPQFLDHARIMSDVKRYQATKRLNR